MNYIESYFHDDVILTFHVLLCLTFLYTAYKDFLTVAYLVTQRDRFFSRELFATLITYFGDADEEVTVPNPAILKPVPLWTGKQVFSEIIRPNRKVRPFVNFEMKERNYDSQLDKKHFCPNDGWVAFRNG